jgi:transcriptional regulator with XRE-family HTH domain
MRSEALEHLDSDEIGHTVREELARRRMSRQALANQAKISISTLEKALSGRRPFTLATVIRLEQALGLNLRHSTPVPTPAPAVAAKFAPESLGGYARGSVQWLEGRYITVRPTFSDQPGLFSYLTAIQWDEQAGHLVFEETQRVDASFSQKGQVSFPTMSGHIYLVTSVSGQYRMAVMGRPLVSGILYGILSSLMAASGTHLLPVSVPLVMIPWAIDCARGEPAFGPIELGHPAFERYKDELDAVIGKGYARFPR